MKPYYWVSETMSDTGGWKARHQSALHSQPHQHIVLMLRGWCSYADRHRKRFESSIGEDYVLGPDWARLGKALHGLLNGDTGDLDCGTLSTIIHDNIAEAGFDWELIK